MTERELFHKANLRDFFGEAPTHRERELMFKAWEARASLAAPPAGISPAPLAGETSEPKQCGLCLESEAFTGTCGGGRKNPKALCFEGFNTWTCECVTTWPISTTCCRRCGRDRPEQALSEDQLVEQLAIKAGVFDVPKQGRMNALHWFTCGVRAALSQGDVSGEGEGS